MPSPRRASMRPSDITDGNSRRSAHWRRGLSGFNEAVGYYRRKLEGGHERRTESSSASMRPSDITDGNTKAPSEGARDRFRRNGFNEAVGYYRRKPSMSPHLLSTMLLRVASMRPSDITDGNRNRVAVAGVAEEASMRPSDITDGNTMSNGHGIAVDHVASMRPSDITDGNPDAVVGDPVRRSGASMRPSDITDGTPGPAPRHVWRVVQASMRPSDITDGNPDGEVADVPIAGASMRPSDITDGNHPSGFNEAVGYYRFFRRSRLQ